MTLHPLQLVLAVLSGWLNEHQAHVVDYLKEENLLKQWLRGQRLRRRMTIAAAWPRTFCSDASYSRSLRLS